MDLTPDGRSFVLAVGILLDRIVGKMDESEERYRSKTQPQRRQLDPKAVSCEKADSQVDRST